MPQSERERLLLFMHVIDDAGVARNAKEDALARLERHFQDCIVDVIEVRTHLDSTIRRQAPHLWSQPEAPLLAGVPRATTMAGPDKPRRPQPYTPTPEQIRSVEGKSPAEALTMYRQWQEEAQRR